VYTGPVDSYSEEKEVEYCDLLAGIFISGIKRRSKDLNIVFSNAQTKLDLHPEKGYMLSSTKFVTMKDNAGNQYKVTIEANPQAPVLPSLEESLQACNLKHSRNGDPVGHYVEAVATKLAFALQDPSVLSEITPAELEVLTSEIKAAHAAKGKANDEF